MRGVVGDSLLPLLSGNTVGLTGVGRSNAVADLVSEDEKLKNWRLENSRSLTRKLAISLIYNTIPYNYTYSILEIALTWNINVKLIKCDVTCMLNIQCVLEVMSMSIYTGLNPFNFTHKPFLQICVRKVAVHL
jgi:hypothetical protein